MFGHECRATGSLLWIALLHPSLVQETMCNDEEEFQPPTPCVSEHISPLPTLEDALPRSSTRDGTIEASNIVGSALATASDT